MQLRRTRDLWQYTIATVDVDIGTVHDFYFDDQTWTIRYIVVETGVIFSGRKVLVSPTALKSRAWGPLHIRATVTANAIENSPSVDLHQPISRQHEIEQHNYYGWPYYWLGAGIWGSRSHPADLAKSTKTNIKSKKETPSTDAYLQSVREVTGYHIEALGGEIGHVEDFLFDDKTWEIRYVIIDTKNWWAGKRVLISPRWIERVIWKDRLIHVHLTRDAIRKSPQWDSNQPIDRKYELQLHKHYNYAPYWSPVKSSKNKS